MTTLGSTGGTPVGATPLPSPLPDARTAPGRRAGHVWPSRRAALPTSSAALAAGSGLVAATLPALAPGLGLALVAVLLVATAATAGRATGDGGERVPWLLAGPAVGLLVLVAVLRDASWVLALCAVLGVAVGAAALSRGRSMTALVLGGASLPVAGLLVPTWLAEPLRGASESARGALAAARGAVLALLLVLVFGALFVSADPTFSGVVDSVTPDLDLASLPARLCVLLLVAGLALAGARLAAGPPTWDTVTPGPGRPRSAAEWFLPVVALDAVFLAFVGVQVAVLLRPRAAGTTFSGAAREGFWQLLVVTTLTLAVAAVASRTAPRGSARQDRLARMAVSVLLALALVVVASALQRMGLYVEAYGATRRRLLVSVTEFWLGAVLAMVAVAGVLQRRRWLPRAVVGSGAAVLLLLAVANPDGLVAGRNVDRFLAIGRLDVAYAAGLSAGAVPALDRLTGDARDCALRDQQVGGGWAGRTLDGLRAERVLEQRPVDRGADCSAFFTDLPRS